MSYRDENKNLIKVEPIPFYKAYITSDNYNVYFTYKGRVGSNSLGDTYGIELNLNDIIVLDDRPFIFLMEGDWKGNLINLSSISDDFVGFHISIPENMNPTRRYFALTGTISVTIGSGSGAVNFNGSFVRSTIGNNTVTQEMEITPEVFNQWFCSIFKDISLGSTSVSAINYTLVLYSNNGSRFYN